MEGLAMIETTRKHFAGATDKDIEKAYLARTVQRRVGHPPDERFKEILSLGENGLQKCPVTVADITNAPTIFGPNRPRIRGGNKNRHEHKKDKRAEGLNSEGILQNAQEGHYYGRCDVCERGPSFGDAVKKN